MLLKDIIEEIENDVVDVVKTNFVYNFARIVPSQNDVELTYESGIEKKGKYLETCVLYVDIRNSVGLTEKHHTQTMGRIYTAFTKAVLKVARHHHGHTRNIIGDRVMIVFPATDCFTNAVDCAISINHIAKHIINEQFSGVEFKCGIGIDFGDIRVIKVGIQRHGNEKGENKGLVWAGYPANKASRLTDNANKTIEKTYFEVVRYPINPKALLPLFPIISPLFGNMSGYDPDTPFYLQTKETVRMSAEEFANNISTYDSGDMFMTGGKLIRFEKKIEKIQYPAILMTSAVFYGFRHANPSRKSVVNNSWVEQKHNINNVSEKVYGGDVYWSL